jgi:hypothetical protein
MVLSTQVEDPGAKTAACASPRKEPAPSAPRPG